MSIKVTEDQLVEECVASRSFLLSQAADLAEEQGKIYRAMAWRWIRDNEKWPSRRQFPRSRYCYKVKWGYGWTFYGTKYYLDDCTIDKAGPTVMPYCLIDLGYMHNKVEWETVPGCLRRIVNRLEKYLEHNKDIYGLKSPKSS